MKPRTALMLGLLVAGVLVLGLLHYLPPIDDFDLANPYWNGLSTLRQLHSSSVVDSLQLLGAGGTGAVLVVVGPSEPFTGDEVAAVGIFVRNGGILVLADDFGRGNELLTQLGLESRFGGELLADPLFYVRNSKLPRATQVALGNLTTLALNYATVLEVNDPESRVAAWSSSFSYLDGNQNGQHDATEPVGPFPIMVEIGYGAGRVYLIADASVFINGMIERGDNRLLLAAIVGMRSVLVDTGHWTPGPLTMVKKAELLGFAFLSRLDIRYALLLVSFAVILRVRKGVLKAAPQQREVERLVEEHPEWDRAILERLQEDRERYGSG